VSEALREAKLPFLVIESDPDAAAELRQQSIETITGNAVDREVVRAAKLTSACCLLVAVPDAFEGGQIVMQARAVNPDLLIIAWAHSEEQVLHLKKHGASTVIMGELEIAKAMIKDVRNAVTVQQLRANCYAESGAVGAASHVSWVCSTRAFDVCYWHKADIPPALTNVRYRG
jgi:voltage-gated potassium channel Kch